ncbi:ABC transporter permease [Marinivivus vitaminiproducens]|uniref:ABC transporter permease n=1 Tax=Marinivivus vitaminiproducens TaxID=3035935 RepID=UPI0027AA7A18|nr:ABC transporter permease [Geminicoccaceae bacterium SCSIO 64248]
MRAELPRWVDYGLLPLLNLAAALVVSGLIVVMLGENPVEALELLISGAFGFGEAIGYTLYYATNFIFTGLAVAVAFHAGLFNIGGEGQAYIGGLGVGLVCLALEPLPFVLVLPAAIVAGAVFGGLWGLIPGWLQARRGSHIVITTIMFNFIASALMTYLLVNVLIRPGQASPESRVFADHVWLPQLDEIAAGFGVDLPGSPLNLAFLFALVACVLVWVYVWQTRAGYRLRVVGQNEQAAVYGGIEPGRVVMVAMAISGALAAGVGLNEIMGAQHRLILGFPGGYGFVGIAVALMGRNHPVGIVLAAILFGALYQGGSELSFDMPAVNRDMVVVIQGLVILFCGALENMFRPALARLFRRPAPAGAVA